jgi:hypothetical protein
VTVILHILQSDSDRYSAQSSPTSTISPHPKFSSKEINIQSILTAFVQPNDLKIIIDLNKPDLFTVKN